MVALARIVGMHFTASRGTFSQALIDLVGADRFLPKFDPDAIGKFQLIG
jgi:hypothetical protein